MLIDFFILFMLIKTIMIDYLLFIKLILIQIKNFDSNIDIIFNF